MRLLKQNDTSKKVLFVMYDSTDHVTPKTGLTPSVQISKNGAAFAAAGGTVAELGNGWYAFTPAAADVDTLGPLALNITATGADPVNLDYWVVAYDPYAATNLGLSNLDAAVSSRSSHTAADVWSVTTRTVTGGSVDSVTNPVSIDMSQTLPATPTADTVGAALKDADTQLDASVSSRATAADVWGYATRTLTDVVQIDMAQSLPATPTADTVGSALKDADTQLDAAVSTRSSHSASDVWAVATRTITGGTVGSVTNPVQIDMSQALPATPTAGTTGAALKDADDYLDAAVSSRATDADVWNYTTRTLTGAVQIDMSQALPATPTAGTTGAALKDADTYLDAAVSTRSSHSASDVWSVATRTVTGGSVDSVTNPVQIDMSQPLPTTPTAGTTGQALKDADTYLDAAVSSRSTFDPTTDTVIVGTNNDKTGYALATSERDAIADAVLGRSVVNVESSAPEHSLCTVVLAVLESQRSDTTWTIYRSNGTTVHATKTLQTDANAKPVVKVD